MRKKEKENNKDPTYSDDITRRARDTCSNNINRIGAREKQEEEK